MKTLATIDYFDASLIACKHLTCPHCGIVDNDSSRMHVGHECSTCGKASESGRLFFPINIHILVDLTHQAFHSTSNVGPISGPQTPQIGTLLFFCSLREALLNNLLIQRMRAEKIPERIIDRLFSDNKLANQKFGPLFYSATKEKWESAVQKASSYADFNFTHVSNLMRRAANIRNRFMHDGNAWEATPDLAEECVNSLATITGLFVTLHNIYVHPITRNNP